VHTAVVQSIQAKKAGLSLSGQLAWKMKPTAQEFQVRIKNSLGHHLLLVGQVTLNAPHRIKFLVRDTSDRSSSLYRLCVRGNHVNRSSDGKAWRPGSHLHVWSFSHQDRHAIDPWIPWPPRPWDDHLRVPLTSLEMRGLFESFCDMLGVVCDVDEFWIDPPTLSVPTFILMPDGEEVP
jgi:hypothetical protein